MSCVSKRSRIDNFSLGRMKICGVHSVVNVDELQLLECLDEARQSTQPRLNPTSNHIPRAKPSSAQHVASTVAGELAF